MELNNMEDNNGNVAMEVNGSPQAVVGTTIAVGTVPVYTDGDYSVYVARIENSEKNDDMDHYLIVNDRYGVIEGSFNRLIEARAGCWALAQAAFEQEQRIHNGQPLVDQPKEEKTRNGPRFN